MKLMVDFFSFCRMKGQLIKELVKTGKDAEQMNKQYVEKISALEKVQRGMIFLFMPCKLLCGANVALHMLVGQYHLKPFPKQALVFTFLQ